MRMRRTFGVMVVVLAFGMTGDLLACGDKFLVAGRGTRYQRPKTARAASVLIYADPASAVAASLKKAKVESLLKLEGHRATKVQIARGAVGRRVERPLRRDSHRDQRLGQRAEAGQPSPDAAIVLGVDDLVKNRSLLQAIDKAVSQHDQNLKKSRRPSDAVISAPRLCSPGPSPSCCCPPQRPPRRLRPLPASDRSRLPGSGWTTPAIS